jgi:hypothetical protein
LFEQELQLINTQAGQKYLKWRCFVIAFVPRRSARAGLGVRWAAEF